MGDYTIDDDDFTIKDPYNYNADVDDLKEKCQIFLTPSITDAVSEQNRYRNLDNQVNINLYQDNYKQTVNTGNQYIEELLETEKNFFENKYGENIYNYLKAKREQYFDNKSIPSGDEDEDEPTSESWEKISEDYKINKITTHFENYNKLNNKISDNLNRINHNTKLNERLMEYRNDLFEDIDYSNRYLIIFYYTIIILFFIYLMITEQLNFTPKTNTIYLILLIFPVIIYPLLWKLMVYLYNKINNNLKNKTPKNAFINNYYD